MRKMNTFLLGAFLAMTTVASAEQRPIPPAFGPYTNLVTKDFAQSKSFKSSDRIVGTYFFYWYDAPTKFHVIDSEDGTDALTTHPPTLKNFSYKSVAWHKKQLRDMEEAGIDVALMVFWGAPSEHDTNASLHWSYAGLKPLVEAREDLLREGKHPPKIGLFYDTSTLQYNRWHEHVDLTTDYGKRWFYATVRDFFSCIPPKHWAMIDDKPIVLMYAAAFAKNYDQGFIDFTKAEFPKEFGGRVPYIAPQNSWRGVKGDNTCAWGGALSFQRAGICELGAGYDHSAVPGRKPLVRERENGKFYEESWRQFLRRPSNFVMIETWDEFHEGTDICESKEYGRKYIDLTRKYAALFKSGSTLPRVKGKFTGAKAVEILLGKHNRENGLRLLENDDGRTEFVTKNGEETRAAKTTDGTPQYFYFAIDESFKWADSMNAKLEVEYLAPTDAALNVDFDSNDSTALFSGAYTRAKSPVIVTTEKWKLATFDLPDACFLGSENIGADFRIGVDSPNVFIHRVRLSRE